MSGLILVAQLTGNSVSGAEIVSGGSGYTSPPTIVVQPPPDLTATQAKLVVTSLVGGSVSAVSVADGGSGYTDLPQIFVLDNPVSPVPIHTGWDAVPTRSADGNENYRLVSSHRLAGYLDGYAGQQGFARQDFTVPANQVALVVYDNSVAQQQVKAVLSSPSYLGSFEAVCGGSKTPLVYQISSPDFPVNASWSNSCIVFANDSDENFSGVLHRFF